MILRLSIPGAFGVAPRARKTSNGRMRCLKPITFAPSRNLRWNPRCGAGATASVASSSANPDLDGVGLVTGEELRAQLDKLQAEANATRSKANSARLRLIRLSEAAEQLQKQAASKVQAGKENDAREVLLQKKKLMQAMEKSKNRIELLDKLSAKLNEAISLKETELIGNVALHCSVTKEDISTPVRVVSPKVVLNEEPKESEPSNPPDQNLEKIQEMGPQECEANNPVESMLSDVEENPSTDSTENSNTLMGMATYNGFLEHVDRQLKGIEDDLLAILRFSNLVMESKQENPYKNLQQTMELLKDISGIRKRVASIMQFKNDG